MQEIFIFYFLNVIKEGSFNNALGYKLEPYFRNMAISGIKNIKNIWATFLMRN